MRISPQYTDYDWKKLTFSAEDEWQKAIDIFDRKVSPTRPDRLPKLAKFHKQLERVKVKA